MKVQHNTTGIPTFWMQDLLEIEYFFATTTTGGNNTAFATLQ